MPTAPAYVFLCWGQSNMQGCGAVDTLPPLRDERILMFKDKEWKPAKEPLSNWTCKIYPNGGAGLGVAFALRILEEIPDITIGLINTSVGGSVLSRWSPEGDLFELSVENTKAALAEGGKLSGILWHQGENETDTQEHAETYLPRFTHVVDSTREAFGMPKLPFITGELGHFLANIGNELYTTVNAELHKAADTLENIACVSSEGLTCTDRNDNIHFDTQSQRTFGGRYAEAYLKMMKDGQIETLG